MLTRRNHLRTMFAALLCATMLAGCEAVDLPGDDPNTGNPIPGDPNDGGGIQLRIPRRLRVFPATELPPSFELRWNYPADAADPASFAIYHSDEPTHEALEADIVENVSGAVRSVLVDIAPDTGVHYFRVAPVGANGEIGEASEMHAIDTGSRIAYVGKLGQSDQNVVYYSNMDGEEPVIISGPMLTGGSVSGGPVMWSPTGTALAFIGDPRATGIDELYVVPGRPTAAFSLPDDLVADPLTNARIVSAPPPVSGPMIADSRVLGAAWSPDGTRLAFIADREVLETFELWLTDTKPGTEPAKLSVALGPEEQVTNVKWSPDAERVAYTVTKGPQRGETLVGVFVKEVDSNEPAFRVDLSDVEGGAAGIYGWSPDGSLLGLIGDLREKDASELFVTEARLESKPELVSDEYSAQSGVRFRACSWSNDGRRIAYAANDAPAKPAELFVVDVQGGGAPFPVSGELSTTAGVADSKLMWSPDDSQLAFLATTLQSSVTELYVTQPVAGAEPFPVSGDLSDDADVDSDTASWSPDGTRLAFIADKITDKKNELFVAIAQPELEPKKVSGTIANGEEVEFARWSADGEHIAFLVRKPSGRSGVQALFLADAEGVFDPVPISGEEPVGSFGFSPIGNELSAPGCGDGLSIFPAMIAPFLMLGYAGRGKRRVTAARTRA